MYTTDLAESFALGEFKFIPTSTIYVTKENIDSIDKRIHTLPAAIKFVAGKEWVYQGQDFYELEGLSLDEQVSHTQFTRLSK